MDSGASDSDDMPFDVEMAAAEAISNLLPSKSKEVYERTYTQFRDWCTKKNISENVLLAYLDEKSRTVKPPTLWSMFSMLKATLNVKENIAVKKFPKLVPYLKSKSVGYKGKKSQVLTKEDITKFIKEANDETYLLMKTVLILGISGACRREELTKMTIDDIEDVGTILIIKVPDTKTYCERTFTVSNTEYIEIYRKYRALRPPHVSSRRLFIRYNKGRCFNVHVGINKIGEIPSLIAKWLGKKEFRKYTGHCFRRSSATLLANAGGDMVSIKRHGGWKSTSVAEGYIEDSLNNKISISNKIMNTHPSTSTENPSNENSHFLEPNDLVKVVEKSMSHQLSAAAISSSGINVGNNCSNCTINVYLTN